MRNAFEQRVAATLGPEWAYEPIKLSYTLERQYVPDFVDVANKRIKESKGRFTASDAPLPGRVTMGRWHAERSHDTLALLESKTHDMVIPAIAGS